MEVVENFWRSASRGSIPRQVKQADALISDRSSFISFSSRLVSHLASPKNIAITQRNQTRMSDVTLSITRIRAENLFVSTRKTHATQSILSVDLVLRHGSALSRDESRCYNNITVRSVIRPTTQERSVESLAERQASTIHTEINVGSESAGRENKVLTFLRAAHVSAPPASAPLILSSARVYCVVRWSRDRCSVAALMLLVCC